MARYDSHRTFIEGIIKNMKTAREELVARTDDLDSQIKYLEDAVHALSAYEFYTTAAAAPVNPQPVEPDDEETL